MSMKGSSVMGILSCFYLAKYVLVSIVLHLDFHRFVEAFPDIEWLASSLEIFIIFFNICSRVSCLSERYYQYTFST